MKKSILIALVFNILPAHAAYVPVTIENKNYRPMGAGFNSRTETLYQPCVDNSLDLESEKDIIIETNKPTGSFNLKLEASQDSLSKKLGIDVGGKHRSGATEYSASAEFLKESKSNGFSIAYNYVSEHLYQETMTPTRARPVRPLPGFTDLVPNRDIFFERCGDQYVWMRDRAARLFININVAFVTKNERTRFAAKFGISSPVTKFNAGFENDLKNFSSSNQMSIKVIQIGGDPSRVGQVLCPKKNNGEIDEECAKSSGAAVDCSFGNIKVCSGLISNAIAYANAQDGDNFPSQIRDGKKYDVTGLHTANYTELGAPFTTPPTAENAIELKVALKQLSDLFEEAFKLFTYADKLYNGRAPRLSYNQKNQMEVLRSSLDKKMRRISMGINACYDFGYRKCQIELDEVKSYLGIDMDGAALTKIEGDIEKLTTPETFVQFCDSADDEHPELKLTMESLKTYATVKLDTEQDRITRGDVCFNLSEWYNSINAIDLSTFPSLKISDLRPLGTLTQLKHLNLSGKNIESLSFLKNLKNLETLNLENNLISNLDGMENLVRLKILNLKNNQITDDLEIQKLKRLNKLENLDLRDNSNDLTCPLKDPSQCRILSFNRHVNLIPNYNSCRLVLGHSALPYKKTGALISGGFVMSGAGFYENTVNLVTQDRCLEVGRLQVARAFHTSTKLKDEKHLIIGGYTNTVEIFNPETMQSELLKAKMQLPRVKHTATLLPDGRVLVVGGYYDNVGMRTRTTKITNLIELIDPFTKTIKKLGELNVPRAEHSATLLPDGKILILGGYSEGVMTSLAEIINPVTGEITLLDSPLNIGRFGHSAKLLSNGSVLIIGGFRWAISEENGEAKKSLKPIAEIESYDPKAEDFFVIKEKLIPARGFMQTWELEKDRFVLIGGDLTGEYFTGLDLTREGVAKTMQLFDEKTNSLYTLPDLSVGRFIFTATPVMNRSLLLIGGSGDEEAHSSSELVTIKKM